jgi:hypothetical protein
MRILNLIAAIIGVASANLQSESLARDQDISFERRQAYPYPANTIDQPVSL